ncbi:unnamed protein product [Blepharisma stoltei]|uniref:Uncharacterized protein n=1 Tax=Blepharisma stoltei TaxID=1481888 RepID=A0AAU9JS64_9CILI|nr:unnamed protein product [Blepharisma stoltei]
MPIRDYGYWGGVWLASWGWKKINWQCPLGPEVGTPRHQGCGLSNIFAGSCWGQLLILLGPSFLPHQTTSQKPVLGPQKSLIYL